MVRSSSRARLGWPVAAWLGAALIVVACGPPPKAVKAPGAFVSASPEEQAGRAPTDEVALRLELKLEAEPVRLGQRWGLDLVVAASSAEAGEYVFVGQPAPQLQGRQLTLEGDEFEFADPCSGEGEAVRIAQGETHRFRRLYGQSKEEALRPGERVTMDLWFCRVQTPAGTWLRRLPVARVTMEAGARGLPKVTVTPAR